ncbi:MAG: hypothetical protein JWO60_1313 [Frankiales bacterium]|nr:hypothetical protein [Frankiales bacterium]
MNRLLLLSGALALVAGAGPVLAADDAPAPVYGACTAPAGALVVTLSKGYEGAVDTPVGALLTDVAPTSVGDVYVDLAGQPVGTLGEALFTLSWDSALPVSDYDMITDGSSDGSTDSPETKVLTVEHCTPVHVDVDVFTGLPTDTLTFAAEATPAVPEAES